MTASKDKTESARAEFAAEAQELIETLSRDLLVLDHAQQNGAYDSDVMNDLFRGVHTLKGLAGMFGLSQLGQLAHYLENLLEDLRLGRKNLSREALDILFEGVEDLQRLLNEAKNPEQRADVDIESFGRSIASLRAKPRSLVDVLDGYDIDAGVRSVLTEYETHRLRVNLEQGVPVYRLHIQIPLNVIDTVLKDLKERGKKLAEIITYLPSMSTGSDEMLDIDVFLASRASEAELRDTLNQPQGVFNLILPRVAKAPEASGSTRPRPRTSIAPAAGAPEALERSKQAKTLAGVSVDRLSLRSVVNTVRVDIGKLDELMNSVGELGIVRGALGKVLESMRGLSELRGLTGEVRRIHRSFEKHLNEVQNNVLDIRMVPLSSLFNKVARAVRQVARENRKEVRMVVTGAETEVDKLVAEKLADPLMHLVRNAIDHGIESSAEREKAGKPATGTLAINAYQKGNHVIIEVQDDGRGIDPEKIRQAAIERAVLDEKALGEMSRDQLLNAVFLPGLSTAEQVTDISGRGVGMDVVKTNLTRMGGSVQLESEIGVGTTVTATVPITLAIISALLIEVAGRVMAMPLASIQEAFKYDPRTARTVEGREVVTLRDSTLFVCRLADWFGFHPRAGSDPQFIVVVQYGNRSLGFAVDKLIGQQDIVIKSMSPSLQGIRGVAGATDLGDQRLPLVLDAPALLEDFFKDAESRLITGTFQ